MARKYSRAPLELAFSPVCDISTSAQALYATFLVSCFLSGTFAPRLGEAAQRMQINYTGCAQDVHSTRHNDNLPHLCLLAMGNLRARKRTRAGHRSHFMSATVQFACPQSIPNRAVPKRQLLTDRMLIRMSDLCWFLSPTCMFLYLQFRV